MWRTEVNTLAATLTIADRCNKIQLNYHFIFTESGYYVPKGFYVIHADGQQSELSAITPAHVSFFIGIIMLRSF